jgi:hypothetical protein
MEGRIKTLKEQIGKTATDANIKILINPNVPLDQEKYKLIHNIYLKYKSEKKNFNSLKMNGYEMFKTMDQYSSYIRDEIFKVSDDISEIVNICVDITYRAHPSDPKTFLWNVLGKELISNIAENRQDDIQIPNIDCCGDIDYLGQKYKMKSIKLEEVFYVEDYI